MKDPETRLIDEKEYLIRHMGPKRQIKTLSFIGKTVGTPLSLLADESGGSILEADAEIVGKVIKSLMDNVDDDRVIEQIEILLTHCELKAPNGYRSIKMENDFHGELMHLFKVVGAILEVNFGRFLGVSTGLVDRVKAGLTTQSAPSSSLQQ